ncbi:MAG: Hpt protein [Chlamydiales bacterium]|nr:Hpt protein [Chlamydiales bacterium]
MDALEDFTRDCRVLADAQLKKIIPYFLKSRQSDLEKLAKALAEKELGVIWLIGHNMKGTGLGYGFPFFSELGQTLQQLAENRAFEQLENALIHLRNYLNRVEVVYDE